MKYIKISNNSLGVNRLHLEKLGLSTKRDDPDSIGQFGSGIKYAPISALRMGLSFAFVGEDNKGKYKLQYRVEDEDGIKSIVYDYGDYEKQSSFTIDAGCMSWDTEWQIYREVVANAKDNGHWTREIVDKVKYVSGQFAVYISASAEMMRIYNNHDYYFCDNRKVIYSDNYTGIDLLEKVDSKHRVYCKTVLVEEKDTEELESMFDYQTVYAELNEDRQLKNSTEERIKITKLIGRISDEELVADILELMFTKNLFEFNMVNEYHWTYASASSQWAKSFYKMFGDNAVLVSPEQAMVSGYTNVVKSSGKKPVVCRLNSIYIFLSGPCKITKSEDAISEEENFDIEKNVNKYPKLVEALKIASYFEPGLSNMIRPLVIYNPKREDDVLGLTVNMSKELERQILISSIHAKTSGIEDLVATIIHEYDHYSTGVSDSMGRDFRNLADKRIANLMCLSYKETPISIHNGFLKIKTNDLSSYSTLDYVIEYLPSFGWHLVRIGKLTFKLETDGEIPNQKGVCQVDETGEHFTIKIGCNGTIRRVE